MKIRTWGAVVMVLLLALALAAPADARPKQGDKTLNLNLTELRFATGTEQACNEDGEDCEDVADVSSFDLGLGGSGGYMFTDLFEAGLSLNLGLASTTSEPSEGSAWKNENSETRFGGGVYGKVHLGSSPTMVPYLAGGLGLGMVVGKDEETIGTVKGEREYGRAVFDVYAQAGVAYYVAEKYGITASATVTRLGRGSDSDTEDDDNGTSAYGEFSVRIGLGLSTYF